MIELMRVRGLTRHFGTVKAVNGIDFSLYQGECFGLLGPNGAGKTTTIELMEGIQKPDGGEILFRGQPIDGRFKSKVGIQFQSTALPEFITVKETLELFSSFYPHPRPLEEVVSLCSLEDILKRDNQKLSGGQRQRMLLGLAILPKPEVVFLDEPTTGLDPQARRNFWDLIRKIKAEGTTILLTTHYMDEAEVLCDRIAIVDKGQILEIDTPQNLLEKHFQGALIRLPSQTFTADLANTLAHNQGLGTVELVAGRWEIDALNLDQAVKALLHHAVDLEGLSIHKPNLEDLFIKLTGSTLRG